MLNSHRSATVGQSGDRLRPYQHSLPAARLTQNAGGDGTAAVQMVLTSQDGDALNRAGDE